MDIYFVEGIDGSGKSYIIEKIKRVVKLLKLSGKFYFGKEPSDLDSGKRVRFLLKSDTMVSREEWLYLFDQDRRENLYNNILPNKDKIIIMDRSYLSTCAYQGEGFKNTKAIFEYYYKWFPVPNMVFYLDIPIDESIRRISKEDIFEKKEYLVRVKEKYEYLLKLLEEKGIKYKKLNGLNKPYILIREIMGDILY